MEKSSGRARRDAPAEAAHSRAYGLIKTAALTGRFRPGDVLTIKALAHQFSCGAMPARVALRRLTSEGAFEALPNRSARVPTLTRREVEQITELRADLEGKAAALAARNITLDQIEHLRELQRVLVAHLDGSDPHALIEADMRFHFEIYRIADNAALLPLIDMLWLRMAPLAMDIMPRVLGAAAQGDWIDHHDVMMAALQSRDAPAAEKAMRRDVLAPSALAGYWDGLGLAAG